MNFLARSAARRAIRENSGIARAVVILLCVVLATAALTLGPGIQAYQARRAQFLCGVALERARESDVADYLENGEIPDLENPILPGESLCPSGGECYLLSENDGYRIVCGLHDSDIARRVRLNASTALERLRRAFDRALLVWGEEPETLSFSLNGREQAAQAGDVPEGRIENGIFYRCEDGEITRLCYIERYRRAVWTRAEGWAAA